MKKVVLLGDSIRQGYDKYVKLAFEGEVQVYSPEENSRFAAYALRQLALWRKQMGCGSDVDLVHWNVGGWDCLHMLDGRPHTDIEVYRDYLVRIHATLNMLFPGAKQIFATTVAVNEKAYEDLQYKRYNQEVEAYNAAARQALEPLGVQINDMYPMTNGLPDEYYSHNLTHLYTKEGTKLLTEKVVAAIEKSLGVKSRPLDYDMLFVMPEKVVGV